MEIIKKSIIATKWRTITEFNGFSYFIYVHTWNSYDWESAEKTWKCKNKFPKCFFLLSWLGDVINSPPFFCSAWCNHKITEKKEQRVLAVNTDKQIDGQMYNRWTDIKIDRQIGWWIYKHRRKKHSRKTYWHTEIVTNRISRMTERKAYKYTDRQRKAVISNPGRYQVFDKIRKPNRQTNGQT